MAITIDPVQPGHVPALGAICFEAFGSLQRRHGVEPDFDSVETAAMVVGLFASRPDFAGFVASDGATILGSNFISFSDPVSAIGPITVWPDAQSRGVGRLLMEAVLDEARRRAITRVRLQQEAINTVSLSLYTKLGFDWRDACALMRLAPAGAADSRIRPAARTDLPLLDAISTRHYHATRRNECEMFLSLGFPGFVLESGGRASGYYFPGFLGHGFAESSDDMAALMLHGAMLAPPQFRKALVPLSQSALHRAVLGRGCRTVKLFNYMTLGEWKTPAGAWIPSIGM